MTTLSGELPRGYESRIMHLVASPYRARGKWELRLSHECYSVPALFDGTRAPFFKTRKAAIAWAAAQGFKAAPHRRGCREYGQDAAWVTVHERPL